MSARVPISQILTQMNTPEIKGPWQQRGRPLSGMLRPGLYFPLCSLLRQRAWCPLPRAWWLLRQRAWWLLRQRAWWLSSEARQRGQLILSRRPAWRSRPPESFPILDGLLCCISATDIIWEILIRFLFQDWTPHG